jgi:hypothetical protein
MSENNGWPDPARPGVPLHKSADWMGAHGWRSSTDVPLGIGGTVARTTRS